MKKAFEIEFRKKTREVGSSPKKRRREKSAADYDREKVSEQFGGIFQGRSFKGAKSCRVNMYGANTKRMG